MSTPPESMIVHRILELLVEEFGFTTTVELIDSATSIKTDRFEANVDSENNIPYVCTCLPPML